MALYRIKRQLRKVPRFYWILLAAITFNLLVYILLSTGMSQIDRDTKDNEPPQRHTINDYEDEDSYIDNDNDVQARTLTVVIREFEYFENRVLETVKKVHEIIPDVHIIVIADRLPYPPLGLPTYAKLVTLQIPLNKPQFMSRPEHFIKTEYVMILPDGCEVIGAEAIEMMMDFYEKQPIQVKSVAWAATAMRNIRCLGLDPNLKQWTLKYFKSSSNLCDAVHGDFVILTKREHYFRLAEPFARPFSIAYFIQSAIRGWKIALYRDMTFLQRETLFTDPHNNWKHKSKEKERTETLYKHFGIKLIHHADGAEEWFGCTKRTSRCFGTVVNSMPEYISEGRKTPPCCLKALRMTARHVFSVLESQGVRYWLEGGTLLGAARNGDIIPWDYDVDIGMYKEDIPKSDRLLKGDLNPYVDKNGFVWERAREGDFYRVHFSQTNRLHVDIYPFYPKNGTMTKDTWFKSHRQDMPFPEHYLKPLIKIDFAGVKAFAPNNWRDFLELKFGKGAIENPKYPDATEVLI